MIDPSMLLERHKPVLRYDSHEIYFADSAAIWTDNPGHFLRRGSAGATLAQTPSFPPMPLLSLAFLGQPNYADGTKSDGEDEISCPYRDYAEQARRLHALPEYANRVYGRWARGSDGRMWLQYWFFYFYNDFELLGDALPAGLHEGDWEMVQLRLDAEEETPDLAVYAKHKHADARLWAQVERVDGMRPVIYVARGSHAAYFSAGTHWGEAWFDHADGKGLSPDLTLELALDEDPDHAWIRWHGFWGDTKPEQDHDLHPFDDSSPRGPGGHAQWEDPLALLKTVREYERYMHPEAHGAPTSGTACPLEPPAPSVELGRTADQALRVEYDCPQWPAGLMAIQLLVTIDSPQDPLLPSAHRMAISSPQGRVDIAVGLNAGWSYEVSVSVAAVPRGEEMTTVIPLTSAASRAALSPST